MGQGRLSPLWVWAKPKVLPFTLLLSLYFQKRGGLVGCKPSQGFAFDLQVIYKWNCYNYLKNLGALPQTPLGRD
jgi:hypothetical protein